MTNNCRPFLSIAPLILLIAIAGSSLSEAKESNHQATDIEKLEKPLFKPFIERYILDEIKSLRQDQQQIRTDIAERFAEVKLESADRAIRYAADTTNIIFYIITAAASILVMLGWRSIRDIKYNIESTTAKKVTELTLEYESRLNSLESSLKERTDQIVLAQKKISDSNLIHSLWMRAALEKSELEKINIYDQILEIRPNDVEALTYKADVLLDIDEDSWALSLIDQALEHDQEYGLAYWQRACARAKLGHKSEAIEDIHRAIELSAPLRQEVAEEDFFKGLNDLPEFQTLAQES